MVNWHCTGLDTLAQPDVDYVSVKVSAVVSQLNPWDFDGSMQRVAEALRPLVRAAAASAPPTFINLDMEEYHDLELTTEAFRALPGEAEFSAVDLGIAVQACTFAGRFDSAGCPLVVGADESFYFQARGHRPDPGLARRRGSCRTLRRQAPGDRRNDRNRGHQPG